MPVTARTWNNRAELPAAALITIPILLFFSPDAPAQEVGAVGHAEVGSVRVVEQIYVAIKIRSPHQQIFVPYCAELEGGRRVLCITATHLEVYVNGNWQPVKLRTTFGVLGAATLSQAKGVAIAPSTEVEFVYEFSRRFFEVDPGQRVRVLIDLWPDERTMRNGERGTRLATPPFRCPQADVGR